MATSQRLSRDIWRNRDGNDETDEGDTHVCDGCTCGRNYACGRARFSGSIRRGYRWKSRLLGVHEGGDSPSQPVCTPPPKVAVGEKFVAEGKSRQIGVIQAHQAADDMPTYGIKKGDWICVAAETLEDIPVDQSRDRTWLRGSPKCQPDLAGSTPLLRQR